MKYILTPLILFLVWKIWRDWENIRNVKARHNARELALQEFETLINRLEIKHANGELSREEFRTLREQAMTQLRDNLDGKRR